MPRLFFDEPLSEELCEAVGDIFPGSLHIRLLGQGGAADAIVWVWLPKTPSAAFAHSFTGRDTPGLRLDVACGGKSRHLHHTKSGRVDAYLCRWMRTESTCVALGESVTPRVVRTRDEAHRREPAQ